MSRSNVVVKNAIWDLCYYLIVILLGFLAPRFIILTYGSEVNGLSSIITQILNVLLLLQAGATTAAVFSLYQPIAENDYQSISRKVASTVRYFHKIALFFAVCIIVAAVITAIVIDSAIKKYLIFIAFLVMGMKSFLDLFFTSKFRVVFTAFEKEKFYISIATLIEQIIYYCLIFITIFFKWHFIFIYIWLLLGCIVKIWYLEYLYNKHYKGVILPFNGKAESIQGVNYALANEVSHDVVSSSIAIILSFMYGLQVTSVYSVYALATSAVSLVSTSVYSAFAPSFGNVVAKHDQDHTKGIFDKFQYIFIVLNSWMSSCMLFLILPFVRLYAGGVTDMNYINPLLAVLISTVTMISAFRVPFNIAVSTFGFFKETWVQPVVSALISIAISIALGRIEYSLILIGPIIFYILILS